MIKLFIIRILAFCFIYSTLLPVYSQDKSGKINVFKLNADAFSESGYTKSVTYIVFG